MSSPPPDAGSAETVALILRSAQEFHSEWFPSRDEANAVQPFWFGARYPRERKFFKKLCQRFASALGAVAAWVESQGSPEALFPELEPRDLLCLAIFLDQHPRNARSLVRVRGGAASGSSGDSGPGPGRRASASASASASAGWGGDAEVEAEAEAEAELHVQVLSRVALVLVLRLLQHPECRGRGQLPGATVSSSIRSVEGSRVLSASAGSAGTFVPLGTEPVVPGLMSITGSSAAELCFLTLVLRHTRQLEEVRAAARLLEELEELESGLEVVAAFRKETTAVLARLEAEAYVQRALREEEPQLLTPAYAEGGRHVPGPGSGPPKVPQGPGTLPCLAEASRHGSTSATEVAQKSLLWLQEPSAWSSLEAHQLTRELRSSLELHGLLSDDAHVVLSFSNGVDSTAHLLLLLAALRRGCGQAEMKERPTGPRFCCLHLSYPNREAEEVEGEIQWARWVCETLGVELYSYSVRLPRPHGEEEDSVGLNLKAPNGLSREEYERYTKEIRFRMYRCLLGESQRAEMPLASQLAAVVLGHHQDDVDENRLDHLQKGHVLGDVEGMRCWREVHGVPLLRPLLGRRKSDFQALLAAYPLPHLRDSTPSWSVRGTTRSLLEGLGEESQTEIVSLLSQFGRLAAEVGVELEAAVADWAKRGVVPLQLPKAAAGLALDLQALLSLQVCSRLQELASLVEAIRSHWNPAVAAAAAASGQGQALGAAAPRRPPGQCQRGPVGEIPESQASQAPQLLLFEKAFFLAAAELVVRRPGHGHYHTSDGASVNRRAVRHLYENVQDCQKPLFSGGLTQELGYLHIAGPPKRILVLYDASAFPEASFKDMRAAIVRAAQRAVTVTAGETAEDLQQSQPQPQ